MCWVHFACMMQVILTHMWIHLFLCPSCLATYTDWRFVATSAVSSALLDQSACHLSSDVGEVWGWMLPPLWAQMVRTRFVLFVAQQLNGSLWQHLLWRMIVSQSACLKATRCVNIFIGGEVLSIGKKFCCLEWCTLLREYAILTQIYDTDLCINVYIH